MQHDMMLLGKNLALSDLCHIVLHRAPSSKYDTIYLK